MNEIAEGSRTAITTSDWTDLILISAVLPAILTPLVALVFRRMRWINKGDLKID